MTIGPDSIERGEAGPGMCDEQYDEMVKNMQRKLFGNVEIVPKRTIEQTMDDLRNRGIDDPYGAIEDE